MPAAPIRTVRMSLDPPSANADQVRHNAGMQAIAKQMHPVWSMSLDHSGFVKKVCALLEPHHASVSVEPTAAPGYYEIYEEVHTPSCRFTLECVCITTIVVGDGGSTAVRMRIATAMPME